MKINAQGEIDLTDPKTVEHLQSGDVLTAKPDKEAEATEKAIKSAKGAKVTLNLKLLRTSTDSHGKRSR